MNTLYKLSSILLCSTMLLGSCAKDDRPDNGGTDTGTDSGEVREVMMTLRNQLVLPKAPTKAGDLPQTTKAETIATAAENTISTLDVYVFGSKTENGDYTFQERFAYRADTDDKLPAGATELQLNTTGADGKETTGLMKLKKGLFVKLYCIANDTTLTDPGSGKEIKSDNFTPITFTTGEDGTPQLATEGIPQESTFTTWHTRLFTATAKADTLAAPLAMSGAYTTPTDLTGFDNSARVQIGFKLTRLAARFDIDNKAEESRFTIETVSLGNGRRGSGYFPIRVYGDLPKAQPDHLITYPVHALSGKDANKGLCTGAFYTYPSPKDDKGFIILNGKYKVNETEMKDVSYQVPFTQQGADGNATWFDIANNHRYTIAITKADPYRLEADIRVADWADDGNIDYTPDNKPGEITVTIPEAYKGDSQYDEETKTVNMSLVDGSYLTLSTVSNSAVNLSKIYAGGTAGKLFDWMEISEPVTVTGANGSVSYTYKVSLKAGYLLGRYPRTTLRFQSLTDGSENTIYIDALAVPKPIETTQPPKAPNGTSSNPNSFDPELLEASVYRITGSRTQVKLTCPDDVELESKPDWLNVTLFSQNRPEAIYDLVLTNRDVVIPGNQGTIVFHNKKKTSLKINITVSLLDAPVTPSYETVGTDNTVIPGNADGSTPDDVQITIKKDNSATIKASSMDGVTVKISYPDGSPEWLSCDGAATTKSAPAATQETIQETAGNVSLMSYTPIINQVQNIKFSPIENKLAGAQKATVTLKNTIGGKDCSFTVTPSMQPATAVKGAEASVPVQDKLAADKKTVTLYQLPGDNAAQSQMQIAVSSLGGSALVIEGDGATVSPEENTANEATYLLKPALGEGKNEATVTLHAKNYTDKTKMTDYAVTVLRSDLTGTVSASLTAAKDQTTSFKASSYEGFSIDKSAIAWQPANQTGGSPWFDITATDFEAGKDKVVTLKAISTATTAQIRPATVTLKNKIVNGGDLKVTVNPIYTVPTLQTVGEADPKQNSLTATATASTLKMYKVDNSKITLLATAIGGSSVSEAKGVTVTGGNTYNTENTYTITMAKDATEGSFKIVNKSDPDKVHTVTVQALSTAITATNITSLPVNPDNSQNSTASSPEGFKASVTSWGDGGAWFELSAADFAKGGVSIAAKVKSSLSNVGIKTATVTLVNNIRGGENKTFTVTPTLTAPTTAFVSSAPTQNTYTANATSMKLYQVTGSKVNITATSFGGNKVVSQTNVTVTGGGNNNATNSYTVTLNNGATSGNFVLGNNSDPSKTKTITIEAPATTMTSKNVSLNVTPGQSTTAASTSPEGFTIGTNDISWGGGDAWFELPSDFTKGSTNITIRVKSPLGNLSIKQATITMRNKITGGTPVSFTVTPVLAAPTTSYVANSSLPTQNTYSNDATSMTLYRVSGSKLNITATSYGGSKVVSQTGVTVTGGGSSSTTNTYTVTLNSTATSGSFVLGNYSDPSKTKTISVSAPVSTMTASNVALGVTPSNTTTTAVNSPEGFTASITSWGGGSEWLELPVTSIAKGSVNLQLRVKSSLTNLTIKPVTVTMKNNITGGENKTFTVTPTLSVPAISSPSGASPSQNTLSGNTVTLYQVAGSKISFTATAYGGTEIKNATGVTFNSTGSASNSYTYTVTLASNTTTSGSFEVVNKSDNSKKTTFTVSVPLYKAPTISSAGGNSPTQNSFSSSTATLYQVSGSKISLKASSLGGSYIKSSTGVTVSGGNNTNTDNTYTLTWNGSSISGSVVFANKTDNRRETTISLSLPSAHITASNLSVTAANSGDHNISVQTAAGVTASVKSWGGGDQWFTFTNSGLSGNGNIIITQSNNVSNVMKPATILLTNKIAGGANKEITVTPTNFVAPGLSSTSKTLDNVKNENTTTATFTVTPKAGAYEYSIRNSDIATLSQSSNTITVTAKYKGSTYIDVKNKSDNNKVTSYYISVSRDYKGQPVWHYYGFYIAPTNEAGTAWNDNLSSKCPSGWYVPTDAEWRTILGSTGTGYAPTDRYNTYKENSVFNVGGDFWSSTQSDANNAYRMSFYSGAAYVKTSSKTLGLGIRCVSK